MRVGPLSAGPFDSSTRVLQRYESNRERRVAAPDSQACFEAGMDDFLAKPIRGEELAAAADHHLAGASGRLAR